MSDHTDDSPLEAEAETLRLELLRVLRDSRVDALNKPFVALLAAADVCMMAAEGSDYMRLRCASAAMRIAQILAPERTHIVPVSPVGN
ncbi:hypothetical protein [Luteitalea pratensis]|uniref:hypothetical protein n=1 Tax=Luteitalea pratensis TaxID=1855912 RepID=UPI0012FFD221|nr:hypothetical protein [Luteitalea pratensis]